MALNQKTNIANQELLFRSAFAMHQQGDIKGAHQIYLKLIKLFPMHAFLLHLLGTAKYQLGEQKSAFEILNKSLTIDPNNAEGFNTLGNILKDLGKIDFALEKYNHAIRINPNYAEAHCNYGNALHDIEKYEDAEFHFNRAIALNSNNASFYYNRGNTLLALERLDEALINYNHAIRLNPNYSDAYNNLGNVLRALRRPIQALTYYDRALALKPQHPEAHNNRGLAFKDLHRLNEALDSYNKALAIKENYADAHYNRALTFLDLGRLNEAIFDFQKTLEIRPTYEFVLGELLLAKLSACDWKTYSQDLAQYEASLGKKGKVTTPLPALCLTDNPRLQMLAAQIYTNHKFQNQYTYTSDINSKAGRKIRLGYMSCDFREHAVSYLIQGVLRNHDRNRFEVHGLDIGEDDQSQTRRNVIATFDKFHLIRSMQNDEIIKLLHKLDIDILIDLTGHTYGERTSVFSNHPIPIQVNYLGFPGTMGASFMDYIIGDPILITDEALNGIQEKVAYLPNCFQANDSERKIGEIKPRSHFGLDNESFIFGCFNQQTKLTPELFDVWLSILRKVPNGILWLIEYNELETVNLKNYALAQGINPDRIVFTGKLPYADHLARYSLVDLALDTTPFSGGATTSDALWGGAPVLTCAGTSFSGRMSASLLHAIGLPELITSSLKDYETLAVKLATHPKTLCEIRKKLAANRLVEPLFDTIRFTHNLERAYEQMLARYIQGLEPDHIHL